MEVHCGFRDAKYICDLLVAMSIADQLQHFKFSQGQPLFRDFGLLVFCAISGAMLFYPGRILLRMVRSNLLAGEGSSGCMRLRPPLSARRMSASPSEVVRIDDLCVLGRAREDSPGTVNPSRSGRRRSSKVMSGFNSWKAMIATPSISLLAQPSPCPGCE